MSSGASAQAPTMPVSPTGAGPQGKIGGNLIKAYMLSATASISTLSPTSSYYAPQPPLFSPAHHFSAPPPTLTSPFTSSSTGTAGATNGVAFPPSSALARFPATGGLADFLKAVNSRSLLDHYASALPTPAAPLLSPAQPPPQQQAPVVAPAAFTLLPGTVVIAPDGRKFVVGGPEVASELSSAPAPSLLSSMAPQTSTIASVIQTVSRSGTPAPPVQAGSASASSALHPFLSSAVPGGPQSLQVPLSGLTPAEPTPNTAGLWPGGFAMNVDLAGQRKQHPRKLQSQGTSSPPAVRSPSSPSSPFVVKASHSTAVGKASADAAAEKAPTEEIGIPKLLLSPSTPLTGSDSRPQTSASGAVRKGGADTALENSGLTFAFPFRTPVLNQQALMSPGSAPSAPPSSASPAMVAASQAMSSNSPKREPVLHLSPALMTSVLASPSGTAPVPLMDVFSSTGVLTEDIVTYLCSPSPSVSLTALGLLKPYLNGSFSWPPLQAAELVSCLLITLAQHFQSTAHWSSVLSVISALGNEVDPFIWSRRPFRTPLMAAADLLTAFPPSSSSSSSPLSLSPTAGPQSNTSAENQTSHRQPGDRWRADVSGLKRAISEMMMMASSSTPADDGNNLVADGAGAILDGTVKSRPPSATAPAAASSPGSPLRQQQAAALRKKGFVCLHEVTLFALVSLALEALSPEQIAAMTAASSPSPHKASPNGRPGTATGKGQSAARAELCRAVTHQVLPLLREVLMSAAGALPDASGASGPASPAGNFGLNSPGGLPLGSDPSFLDSWLTAPSSFLPQEARWLRSGRQGVVGICEATCLTLTQVWSAAARLHSHAAVTGASDAMDASEATGRNVVVDPSAVVGVGAQSSSEAGSSAPENDGRRPSVPRLPLEAMAPPPLAFPQAPGDATGTGSHSGSEGDQDQGSSGSSAEGDIFIMGQSETSVLWGEDSALVGVEVQPDAPAHSPSPSVALQRQGADQRDGQDSSTEVAANETVAAPSHVRIDGQELPRGDLAPASAAASQAGSRPMSSKAGSRPVSGIGRPAAASSSSFAAAGYEPYNMLALPRSRLPSANVHHPAADARNGGQPQQDDAEQQRRRLEEDQEALIEQDDEDGGLGNDDGKDAGDAFVVPALGNHDLPKGTTDGQRKKTRGSLDSEAGLPPLHIDTGENNSPASAAAAGASHNAKPVAKNSPAKGPEAPPRNTAALEATFRAGGELFFESDEPLVHKGKKKDRSAAKDQAEKANPPLRYQQMQPSSGVKVDPPADAKAFPSANGASVRKSARSREGSAVRNRSVSASGLTRRQEVELKKQQAALPGKPRWQVAGRATDWRQEQERKTRATSADIQEGSDTDHPPSRDSSRSPSKARPLSGSAAETSRLGVQDRPALQSRRRNSAGSAVTDGAASNAKAASKVAAYMDRLLNGGNLTEQQRDQLTSLMAPDELQALQRLQSLRDQEARLRKTIEDLKKLREGRGPEAPGRGKEAARDIGFTANGSVEEQERYDEAELEFEQREAKAAKQSVAERIKARRQGKLSGVGLAVVHPELLHRRQQDEILKKPEQGSLSPSSRRPLSAPGQSSSSPSSRVAIPAAHEDVLLRERVDFSVVPRSAPGSAGRKRSPGDAYSNGTSPPSASQFAQPRSVSPSLTAVIGGGTAILAPALAETPDPESNPFRASPLLPLSVRLASEQATGSTIPLARWDDFRPQLRGDGAVLFRGARVRVLAGEGEGGEAQDAAEERHHSSAADPASTSAAAFARPSTAPVDSQHRRASSSPRADTAAAPAGTSAAISPEDRLMKTPYVKLLLSRQHHRGDSHVAATVANSRKRPSTAVSSPPPRFGPTGRRLLPGEEAPPPKLLPLPKGRHALDQDLPRRPKTPVVDSGRGRSASSSARRGRRPSLGGRSVERKERSSSAGSSRSTGSAPAAYSSSSAGISRAGLAVIVSPSSSSLKNGKDAALLAAQAAILHLPTSSGVEAAEAEALAAALLQSEPRAGLNKRASALAQRSPIRQPDVIRPSTGGPAGRQQRHAGAKLANPPPQLVSKEESGVPLRFEKELTQHFLDLTLQSLRSQNGGERSGSAEGSAGLSGEEAMSSIGPAGSIQSGSSSASTALAGSAAPVGNAGGSQADSSMLLGPVLSQILLSTNVLDASVISASAFDENAEAIEGSLSQLSPQFLSFWKGLRKKERTEALARSLRKAHASIPLSLRVAPQPGVTDGHPYRHDPTFSSPEAAEELRRLQAGFELRKADAQMAVVADVQRQLLDSQRRLHEQAGYFLPSTAVAIATSQQHMSASNAGSKGALSAATVNSQYTPAGPVIPSYFSVADKRQVSPASSSPTTGRALAGGQHAFVAGVTPVLGSFALAPSPTGPPPAQHAGVTTSSDENEQAKVQRHRQAPSEVLMWHPGNLAPASEMADGEREPPDEQLQVSFKKGLAAVRRQLRQEHSEAHSGQGSARTPNTRVGKINSARKPAPTAQRESATPIILLQGPGQARASVAAAGDSSRNGRPETASSASLYKTAFVPASEAPVDPVGSKPLLSTQFSPFARKDTTTNTLPPLLSPLRPSTAQHRSSSRSAKESDPHAAPPAGKPGLMAAGFLSPYSVPQRDRSLEETSRQSYGEGKTDPSPTKEVSARKTPRSSAAGAPGAGAAAWSAASLAKARLAYGKNPITKEEIPAAIRQRILSPGFVPSTSQRSPEKNEEKSPIDDLLRKKLESAARAAAEEAGGGGAALVRKVREQLREAGYREELPSLGPTRDSAREEELKRKAARRQAFEKLVTPDSARSLTGRASSPGKKRPASSPPGAVVSSFPRDEYCYQLPTTPLGLLASPLKAPGGLATQGGLFPPLASPSLGKQPALGGDEERATAIPQ